MTAGRSPGSTRTAYSVGDPVIVRWMGDAVAATIHEVRTRRDRSGRPLLDPRYRVTIPGVAGHPWYYESEIEDGE